MKKIVFANCILAALLGASLSTRAGFLSGPLTSSQSNAKQQSMPQPSASTTTANTSSNHSIDARLGGAPTSEAVNGQGVNGELPPVVDATPGPGSVTLEKNQGSQIETSVSAQPGNHLQVAAVPVSVVGSGQQSDEQRLNRVERQLDNLVHMNLPQQVNDIQMQLQQLSGQLQVQEHDLKLLNLQQRNFYEDLDQRLKKIAGAQNDDSNSNGDSTQAHTSVSKTTDSEGKSKDRKISSNNIELQDSNAYKSALDMVAKRQYDAAVEKLSRYISAFPNGEYVDKAHYWLGEIYFLQKSYKKSQGEFQALVAGYKKSLRVPDALYKLALIDEALGNSDQAKKRLLEIQRHYPDSAAAQLAAIQYKRLTLQ